MLRKLLWTGLYAGLGAGATSDTLVEHGADRLQELADRAAERDGVASKLARPLAEDAAFLRKLRPSLMKARVRGEAPTDEKPRPNPFVIAGAALAVGIFVAKWIDWRGHAHPRY